MKNLVLHVGYPKTATTTLQDRWLHSLHNDGKVNLIGRYNTSGVTSHEESINFYLELMRNPQNLRKKIEFSSSKLNVISTENITLPLLIRQKSHENRPYVDHGYSVEKEHFVVDIPTTLNEFLEPLVDDIQIWMSIRHQKEILYSLYDTYYNFFSFDHELDSWKRFYDYFIDSEYSKDLDYYEVVNKYCTVFDRENINLYSFNLFRDNKDAFINQVCKLFDMTPSEFKNSVDVEAHLNKTKPDSVVGSRWIRLYKILNEYNVAIAVTSGIKSLLGQRYYNKFINFAYKDYEIDDPTQKQLENISNKYEESNRMLADEYDIHLS